MSESRTQQAALLVRTVGHLRPAQIVHRARIRGQRALVSHVPESMVRVAVRDARPGIGWPPRFVPVDGRLLLGFPSAEDNARGTFCFLEDLRATGDPPDWHPPGVSRLWGYHLHSFEWAWSFVAHEDRPWARAAFAKLLTSWRRATRLGRGDAWSPYVASLRAWSLCGAHAPLFADVPEEGELVDDLALHAAFLRAHLELDVGGNHLIKNLKALIGLGVFLGDDRLVQRSARRLKRELAVQVLPDGGHYERSPSYHCQVLADLVDVRDLLEAAGRPAIDGLEQAVAAMRRWLGAMLLPDGDVPLFNDCTLVGADRVRALDPTPTLERLSVLEQSGYVVVRATSGIHLVADVGPPCPPDLPAHAHADALSFELTVDGRRVVVDSGTSSYEAGARRAYERSTRAHNTVEVDDANQTEVWAVFRAARLARVRLEHAETRNEVMEITGSHDGYRRLPGSPWHRRTWRIGAGGVELLDEVAGHGRHRVVSSLHVRAESDPVVRGDGTVVIGPLTISFDGPNRGLDIVPVEIATGFGQSQPAYAVRASFDGSLPVAFRTKLAVRRPEPAPTSTIADTNAPGGAR